MFEYLEQAIHAAREAGAIQRDRLWRENRIDFKGETDLVTDVDKKCEEMIVLSLKSAFPDHDVLAEEYQYPDSGSGWKWIIDPLDGTVNYAHGFPWFAVSIALEVEGEVQVGVVYHPVLDEMFTAIKGRGACLNGKAIHVSGRTPLRSSLVATGFPYDRTMTNENNFDNFIRMQVKSRAVRRAGAAALDLAYVAAGRLDGYWEIKLKPWDVAAGKLLVEEAGGRVTDHQGNDYSIYNHRIVATNGAIHQELLAVLTQAE